MTLPSASRRGSSSSTMAMMPGFVSVSFTWIHQILGSLKSLASEHRLHFRGIGRYPALGGDRYLLMWVGFELFGHPDEVGEGLGLGFLHHVRAVGLDGELAGPQFVRDLLVQKACHHKVQHFLFARRQRVETRANLG